MDRRYREWLDKVIGSDKSSNRILGELIKDIDDRIDELERTSDEIKSRIQELEKMLKE